MIDLRAIAAALGGEVSRGAVLAPGPGHSRKDRSLSVKLSHQSPDGFIVHSHAGDDFRVCRDYVAGRLGLGRDRSRRPDSPRAAPSPRADLDRMDDEARIARATALWNEAADPRGTIVEAYLRSRGLELPDDVAGATIRFHGAAPWLDRSANTLIRVPAMLAAMRSIDADRITAVHRTRLTPDGAKVDRRMLGIAAGAAVKLDPDENVTAGLTIGEGIETCLAGRQLGFRPVWALASAGAVAAFPVLAGIEALTVLEENDEASDRATSACGARWHEASREVVLVRPIIGNDVNDAIREAA